MNAPFKEFVKARALLFATCHNDTQPLCLAMEPHHKFPAAGMPFDLADVEVAEPGLYVWEGAVEFEHEGDVVWSATHGTRMAFQEDLNGFGFPTVEWREPDVVFAPKAEAAPAGTSVDVLENEIRKDVEGLRNNLPGSLRTAVGWESLNKHVSTLLSMARQLEPVVYHSAEHHERVDLVNGWEAEALKLITSITVDGSIREDRMNRVKNLITQIAAASRGWS